MPNTHFWPSDPDSFTKRPPWPHVSVAVRGCARCRRRVLLRAFRVGVAGWGRPRLWLNAVASCSCPRRGRTLAPSGFAARQEVPKLAASPGPATRRCVCAAAGPSAAGACPLALLRPLRDKSSRFRIVLRLLHALHSRRPLPCREGSQTRPSHPYGRLRARTGGRKRERWRWGSEEVARAPVWDKSVFQAQKTYFTYMLDHPPEKETSFWAKPPLVRVAVCKNCFTRDAPQCR